MSYKSQAQRGEFHILEKEGKISHAEVTKWDKESRGMKNLPYHNAKKKGMSKGMRPPSK